MAMKPSDVDHYIQLQVYQLVAHLGFPPDLFHFQHYMSSQTAVLGTQSKSLGAPVSVIDTVINISTKGLRVSKIVPL